MSDHDNSPRQSARFVRVREAAELLGVGQAAIRRALARGKLPGAIRLDDAGPWLIPRELLEGARR